MDDFLSAGTRTLHLVLLLSAAPVIVATVVGLVVGLFQTVTQLQEQTLPYGIKLLSVIMCLTILMGWMSGQILEFAEYAASLALSRRP